MNSQVSSMYLLVKSGKRSENVKLAQELEICAER